MPLIDETYIAALKARLQAQQTALPALDDEHSSDEQQGRSQGMVCTQPLEKKATISKMLDESHDTAAGEGSNEDDEVKRAYKKIVKLVSHRERSYQMLIDRLTRDGFSPDVAQAALDHARRLGIVDDRRFADMLLRSRLASGHGRQGIRRELEELGITAEELETWHAEEQDELSRALSFLERKPPTAKNKRDAAYRKLVTKGYSSDIASSAARIWSESA